MNHVKNLLVVFILFFLFDLPFMIGINGKMYKSMFERINGVKQETWSTRTWIARTVHGLFTKGRTPKQTKTAFLILLKLPLFIIKIYYKCIRPKRMFLVLNQFKILTNNSIKK